MSNSLRAPTCAGCPHDLYFGDSIPKKQYGVMMHCGEHFCTGGKRAHRFKRGDPKSRVPDWCPKRKTPCELRLYSFKDIHEWFLHTHLCSQLGKALQPSGFRYALKVETHTGLTPYEFWKRCALEPCEELLGLEPQLYEILEIDDGLKPVFFYMTEGGLVVERFFDAARARKNSMGESV